MMANDLWATPQYIFDWLDEEFHFEIDAAANDQNHKCERWFGDHIGDPGYAGFYVNGLITNWFGWVENTPKTFWLNPPYSDPLPWVKKAYEESLHGATVVCLLPADTSTKWFHDWVYGKSEIRFIKGRVRFVDSLTGKETKDPPKFGSMIAIYGPGAKVGQVFSVDRPKIKRAC